jgi:hypothetical protein
MRKRRKRYLPDYRWFIIQGNAVLIPTKNGYEKRNW